MRWLPVLAAILLAAPLHAQQQGVDSRLWNIGVRHAGDDLLGDRLAYHIREAYRESSKFTLESDTGDPSYVRLHLTTSDPHKDTEFENSSTTFSAVWTFRTKGSELEYYISTYLGHVGAQRLRGMAENVVASTRDAMNQAVSKIMEARQGG